MTPAEAQALQDDTTAQGASLAWVVSSSDPEHHGKFVARALTADHTGEQCLPGALVADTLEELQEQLPAGLTCRRRTSIDPPEVLEVWD